MFSNSKNSVPSHNLYSFVGFVFLPTGIDREEYVRKCQEIEQISVIDVEFNRILHRVRVGRNTFKDIIFPTSTDTLGSAVICLNLEIKEQYIVIDTIKTYEDAKLLQLEQSFRVFRKNNVSLVDFHIKGLTGELDLIVDSGDQENIESNWNFFNKKRRATLKLYIQGLFRVIAEKSLQFIGYELIEIKLTKKGKDHINLKFEKDKGISYFDDFNNKFTINKDGIIALVPDKKLKVGNGNYSVLLGDIMKEAVDNIIDELGKATVTTVMGPMPLLNAAQILLIKKKTAQTLSKYHYTQ